MDEATFRGTLSTPKLEILVLALQEGEYAVEFACRHDSIQNLDAVLELSDKDQPDRSMIDISNKLSHLQSLRVKGPWKTLFRLLSKHKPHYRLPNLRSLTIDIDNWTEISQDNFEKLVQARCPPSAASSEASTSHVSHPLQLIKRLEIIDGSGKPSPPAWACSPLLDQCVQNKYKEKGNGDLYEIFEEDFIPDKYTFRMDWLPHA